MYPSSEWKILTLLSQHGRPNKQKNCKIIEGLNNTINEFDLPNTDNLGQ